jgi:predicted ATPase
MLKSRAGVLETDPAETAFVKIARLVETGVDRELAVDSQWTAAALASTLGLESTNDPLGALDPRERYRAIVAAWRALFASLAATAPLTAVFEDLHWADPTMLEVLDELAERLEGPILFLCTTRLDLLRSRPDWGGQRTFSFLPLDPLTGDESARLVSFLPRRRRAVGASPPDPRAVRGKPVLPREIVRHLIDEGLLAREGDRWQAGAGIDGGEARRPARRGRREGVLGRRARR